MRRKELIEKIEKLEERIVELEHPVEFEIGQKVKAGKVKGVICGSFVNYETILIGWYESEPKPLWRVYKIAVKGKIVHATKSEIKKL